MIDEQSSASGHDYALDRSAIGAGTFLIVFSNYKYLHFIVNGCILAFSH